jgi:hypothetical protein
MELLLSTFDPKSYAFEIGKPVGGVEEEKGFEDMDNAVDSGAEVLKLDKKLERLKQMIGLPGHIVSLCNSMDIDALRALIDTHFIKDCVLSTTRLKNAVGRDHIFKFFVGFMDGFPDGLMSMKRARLGKIDEVTFTVGFNGTSTCIGKKQKHGELTPEEQERCKYIGGGKPCPFQKLGKMTAEIIGSVKRFFYAEEKDRLLKVEKQVMAGEVYPFFTGDLVGKFTFAPSDRKAGGGKEVKVSKVDLKVKFKNMKGVPVV